MSNLGIYLIGVVIVGGAIIFGLHQLGVPPIWLGVTGAIFFGIGLMKAISNTQRKES